MSCAREFQQCGGDQWAGNSCCAGLVCNRHDEYYSQCVNSRPERESSPSPAPTPTPATARAEDRSAACAKANSNGWTGFYSNPLSVEVDGVARPHPIVADYGLDRSGLWGAPNPEAHAPAWCALRGASPDNWGARAYLLRPEGGGCFAPSKHEPFFAPPSHRLAHDFAQFQLLGRTIRFRVDLHRVGCGGVLTLYLAGLPAVGPDYQFAPQQAKDARLHNPGCAGRMYYADANPEMTGCESYGVEFDLFEGNVESMHTTAHGCVSGLDVPGSNVKSGFVPRQPAARGSAPTGSSGWFGRVDRSAYPDPNVPLMHNRICDGDGTGAGVSGTGVVPFANGSYGWGEEHTINTQLPFDVAVRFDDVGGIDGDSWAYTAMLSQAGRSLWQTVRRADAVKEVALFPRAGRYRVRFVAATTGQGSSGREWVVVNKVFYPLRRVSPEVARSVTRLQFSREDGESVHLDRGLELAAVVQLGGVVFSNNATGDGMATELKQRAWDEMGTALRSKGLAMVLAYWAQPATTLYKPLAAWVSFWLNGQCERRSEASPSGAPYPWRDEMGFGCVSGIAIEANAAGGPWGDGPPPRAAAANSQDGEAPRKAGGSDLTGFWLRTAAGGGAEQLVTPTSLIIMVLLAVGAVLVTCRVSSVCRAPAQWLGKCLRRQGELLQQQEVEVPGAGVAEPSGSAE